MARRSHQLSASKSTICGAIEYPSTLRSSAARLCTVCAMTTSKDGGPLACKRTARSACPW